MPNTPSLEQVARLENAVVFLLSEYIREFRMELMHVRDITGTEMNTCLDLLIKADTLISKIEMKTKNDL